jgi:hypothetical protein
MKHLHKGQKCQWQGCEKEAVVLAYDRVDKVIMACCEVHAEQAAERDYPEYHANCPNCNCEFGVN